jgi:hypothetical protein
MDHASAAAAASLYHGSPIMSSVPPGGGGGGGGAYVYQPAGGPPGPRQETPGGGSSARRTQGQGSASVVGGPGWHAGRPPSPGESLAAAAMYAAAGTGMHTMLPLDPTTGAMYHHPSASYYYPAAAYYPGGAYDQGSVYQAISGAPARIVGGSDAPVPPS